MKFEQILQKENSMDAPEPGGSERDKEPALDTTLKLDTALMSMADMLKKRALVLFADLKAKGYDMSSLIDQELQTYPTEITEKVKAVIAEEDLPGYENFSKTLDLKDRLELNAKSGNLEKISEEMENRAKMLFGQLNEKYSNIRSLIEPESQTYPTEVTEGVKKVIKENDYALYEEFAKTLSLVDEIRELQSSSDLMKRDTAESAKVDDTGESLDRKDFSISEGTVRQENAKANEDVLIAEEETREVYEKSWPYTDYAFDEWRENGFLVTKEGIPSKLDSKEYTLVRTKEFKEWFGDWEGNNDSASKMIDPQTGEPKRFFRGDKSLYKESFLVKPEEKRTIDDNEYADQQGREIAQSRNQGVFFTNNKEVALAYGTDVDALTLGKFGLHPEQDHPKTFPKIKKWLKSFAEKDPQFWNRIFDVVCGKTANMNSEVYERNFRHFFQFTPKETINEEIIESLLCEIRGSGRENDPGYYIDIFVEKGVFDAIIDGFSRQIFEDPKAPLGKQWFIDFGSELAPQWSKDFKKLKREYLSEPLALSTVFIRSFNPKEMRYVNMDQSFEVYQARMNGYDSFINEKGVGKHIKGVSEPMDEIVVFDTENIWVVKKESLADMVSA